jgi:hypothetical protein
MVESSRHLTLPLLATVGWCTLLLPLRSGAGRDRVWQAERKPDDWGLGWTSGDKEAWVMG